jgi:lysophospholipase L1-like esterase
MMRLSFNAALAALIATIAIPAVTYGETTATAKKERGGMWGFFQAHYANRVESFRSENFNYSHVVLLGDSITEGFKVDKWFPFRRVLNRGIGSDIIGVARDSDDKRGVIQRLDSSVFDCGASHVFLLIGINDFGDDRTVEVMADGYRTILKTIKERRPETVVHVQSLMPARGAHTRHQEKILKFNTELQRLAREFDFPYVDLHSLLKDSKGELKEECTYDGLHLNDQGYSIWKKEVDRIMAW